MRAGMEKLPAGRTLPRTITQRLTDVLRRRVWGIAIPRSVWVAPSALIDRTHPDGVHIGEDCVIEHEAVVLAHDRTRGMSIDTYVGARCHLGARSIVMPGVRIGDDCVVEPGAVVSRDLPDGARVRGNPARIVEPGDA
jgi:acetyltransferase-like isoleucine patch superfamily enzyme